jgi:redox-sensitive bicupin YhaK (pirin superfamily)
VTAAALPIARSADGRASVKVIAGQALGVSAAVETRTPILYFDVTVEPGGRVELDVPAAFNVAVYVYGGEASVGDGTLAQDGTFALLGAGDRVAIACAPDAAAPARALVLGGEPLGEPIARYGPFVMNTEAEIRAALDDFRTGRFGDIAR